MTAKAELVPLFSRVKPEVRSAVQATAAKLGTTSAKIIEEAVTKHLLELSNSDEIDAAPDNSYESEIARLSRLADDCMNLSRRFDSQRGR